MHFTALLLHRSALFRGREEETGGGGFRGETPLMTAVGSEGCKMQPNQEEAEKRGKVGKKEQSCLTSVTSSATAYGRPRCG